jgi:hypothetical protein
METVTERILGTETSSGGRWSRLGARRKIRTFCCLQYSQYIVGGKMQKWDHLMFNFNIFQIAWYLLDTKFYYKSVEMWLGPSGGND